MQNVKDKIWTEMEFKISVKVAILKYWNICNISIIERFEKGTIRVYSFMFVFVVELSCYVFTKSAKKSNQRVLNLSKTPSDET